MAAQLNTPTMLSNPGLQLPFGSHLNNVQAYAQGAPTQMLALSTTAASATSAFTMAVPAGCLIKSIDVYTGVAFGSSTDVTIAIGNVAAGAQYVAATSIKAAAKVSLAFVGSGIAALANMPAGTPNNLFITLTQTGSNTATGAATLVVTFSVP